MKYPSSCMFAKIRLAAPMVAIVLMGLSDPQTILAQSSVADQELTNTVYDKLGLVGGQVVEVQPVATASAGVQLVIPINEWLETIDLTAVSVRSPNYTVLIQKHDGSYETNDPTPERNFRGSIIGHDGSVVAATYDEAGFRAKIQFGDGSRYWVEPIASQVASASPEQHIVYRDEDLMGRNEVCAEPVSDPNHVDVDAGSVAAMTGLAIAELAVDADYEYYLAHGSSTTAVQNQINTVINAMNVAFERDVQIRHVITTIIVRTTASDPYTYTNSDLLLSQFKSHWNANQAAVQRDVAQLFTGREIDSSVIGIAYLGEICSTLAYSVVQSDFNGSALAYQTDLSAHELGHNWDAGHCNCATPPSTMNPYITGANLFSSLHSIPSITAYRDSRGCLDTGDELLRITIGAPATPLQIGQAVQLSATADFRYGPDQGVTSQTIWSVDRPEFASVSPTGLLSVLDAEAESCVTVNALYTSDGITKSAQKQIIIKDPTSPLALLASSPPANAIDARRPTDPNGNNRTGWSIFDLTLNSEPCSLSPSRFTITQVGGTQTPPAVSSVTSLGGPVVRLTLNKAIDSGAWTTIDDTLSDVSLRIGFLPGDVDGNGTAAPSDILALIDSLNGINTRPAWATDLDRSGSPAPADILTCIDLLNGTGGYTIWNGAKLPPS